MIQKQGSDRGDLWIRRSAASDSPMARLICFPHAGGGASSFNGWRALLPSGIELLRVQLPGREDNLRRPPFCSIDELIPEILPHFAAFLDKPFAFYGHSLGAIVAFDLVRELRRAQLPLPLGLFLSGRRAPQLPLSHPAYCLLDDSEFLGYLRTMGGTPKGILEKPHWQRKLFPTIRADLKISDLYVYRDDLPLPCPIFCFVGAGDQLVKREECEAWRRQTSVEFGLRTLQGGHFLERDEQSIIVQEIVEFLMRNDRSGVVAGDWSSDARALL